MSEQALHLYKNGMSYAEMLKKVDYTAGRKIPSTFPSYTNVIDNIPRPHSSDIVYKHPSEGSSSRSRKWLRPEQKNVDLLEDLITMYCPPGGLVLDAFMGTGSTLKACLRARPHRRFVGCDKDKDCIEQSMESILQVFADQLMDASSDLKGDEIVSNAAATYTRIYKKKRAQQRRSLWKAPEGCPAVQTFPPHIIEYLCNHYKDGSLTRYSNVPLDRWPLFWRDRFNQTSVDAMLAAECTVLNVQVRPSRIPKAGMGLFATRRIPEKTVIAEYYGSLVYRDIGAARDTMSAYGEGIMAVTQDEFRIYSMETKFNVDTKDTKRNTVWICPAKFAAARYINDARYFPPEKAPTPAQRQRNPNNYRSANIKYEAIQSVTNKDNYIRPDLIRILSTRQIEPNEELYGNYGDKYHIDNTEK